MKITRCSPETISRYCDGELSADRIDRLQAHLETCRSCRQVMDDYKSVSRMAAEEMAHRFPLETGPNLEYRIMNQLKSGSIEQEHSIYKRIGSKIFQIGKVMVPTTAMAAGALFFFTWTHNTPIVEAAPSAIISSISGDVTIHNDHGNPGNPPDDSVDPGRVNYF